MDLSNCSLEDDRQTLKTQNTHLNEFNNDWNQFTKIDGQNLRSKPKENGNYRRAFTQAYFEKMDKEEQDLRKAEDNDDQEDR